MIKSLQISHRREVFFPDCGTCSFETVSGAATPQTGRGLRDVQLHGMKPPQQLPSDFVWESLSDPNPQRSHHPCWRLTLPLPRIPALAPLFLQLILLYFLYQSTFKPPAHFSLPS